MKMFVSFDLCVCLVETGMEATVTEWSPPFLLRVSSSLLSVCVCVCV
jgi:hypothetical protein